MTPRPSTSGPGEVPPVRLFGWTALVVALVVQVYALYTGDPPGAESVQVPGIDKVGHLLLFGIPAGLAWWLGARWLVPVLVLHALVSEPLQGWLQEHRSTDPLDLVADLVGIGLGVLVARALTRRSVMMGE